MTRSTRCPHPDESLVNIVPVREGPKLVAFTGDCGLCWARGVFRTLSEPPVRTSVVAEGADNTTDDGLYGFHNPNARSK